MPYMQQSQVQQQQPRRGGLLSAILKPFITATAGPMGGAAFDMVTSGLRGGTQEMTSAFAADSGERGQEMLPYPTTVNEHEPSGKGEAEAAPAEQDPPSSTASGIVQDVTVPDYEDVLDDPAEAEKDKAVTLFQETFPDIHATFQRQPELLQGIQGLAGRLASYYQQHG